MVRRDFQKCCARSVRRSAGAGASLEVARESSSNSRKAGGSRRKRQGLGETDVVDKPEKQKVCSHQAQESQLLTCDQMRWKYFLRSGHWRIPGEEGLGSWKACKVNFIDDGKAEQSLSLQVAVQPPKDSQVHTVLATYKQTIRTGPAPSGPLPKIATASHGEDSLSQCSDCHSSTEDPYLVSRMDVPIAQASKQLDIRTCASPGGFIDVGTSLPPSPSPDIHQLLASPNEDGEEEAVAALLQTPDYN